MNVPVPMLFLPEFMTANMVPHAPILTVNFKRFFSLRNPATLMQPFGKIIELFRKMMVVYHMQ